MLNKLTITVSKSKNFNKYEITAEYTVDDTFNYDAARETCLAEVKKGLDELLAQDQDAISEEANIETQTNDSPATDKQIRMLIAKNYPGDPYVLTKDQAWKWLSKNK